MTVPVPVTNRDRTLHPNLKEDIDLKGKPKIDTALVPPKEKEIMTVVPEQKVESSPILKYEKAVPKKEEIPRKEP